MNIGALALLVFITAQRLLELVYARRNVARLMAKGAYEVAPGHYPLMVLLHSAWIAGLWLLGTGQSVNPLWLGVFVLLQALRFWMLAALGERWTTRILVLPGAPLITSGPYRFMRHPNYVVVVGEMAVVPLALGLNVYALVFSVLNALVLTIRIRAENTALAQPPK